MVLHPVDRLQEAQRPVRRVRLEQNPTIIFQPQPERAAHAQLAEERLPDPRSEARRAEGIEVSGDPPVVRRSEDGPREDAALPRSERPGDGSRPINHRRDASPSRPLHGLAGRSGYDEEERLRPVW